MVLIAFVGAFAFQNISLPLESGIFFEPNAFDDDRVRWELGRDYANQRALGKVSISACHRRQSFLLMTILMGFIGAQQLQHGARRFIISEIPSLEALIVCLSRLPSENTQQEWTRVAINLHSGSQATTKPCSGDGRLILWALMTLLSSSCNSGFIWQGIIHCQERSLPNAA